MTAPCTVSTVPGPASQRGILEVIQNPQEQKRACEFSIPLPVPFHLEYGVIEQPVTIQARLVGPENAPVILVLGGISANRYPDETHPNQPGWWSDIVGHKQVINTQRFRVLSFDFLPGPDKDLDALTLISPADQASVAAIVCEHLKISVLHAFVGASYGGMIALNFARLFPEKVQRLVMLCASHRAHPIGCAWRSIQRKIVQFGLDTAQPDRALSLARELGMTTYRTAEEFGHRFSSQTEVQTYLESRGQAFIGKMSPARYLALSESIDLHQVEPRSIPVPTSLIGFRQDQLVPIDDLRTLAQQLPKLGNYFECDSIYGHDAFLKEIPFLEDAIRQSLL